MEQNKVILREVATGKLSEEVQVLKFEFSNFGNTAKTIQSLNEVLEKLENDVVEKEKEKEVKIIEKQIKKLNEFISTSQLFKLDDLLVKTVEDLIKLHIAKYEDYMITSYKGRYFSQSISDTLAFISLLEIHFPKVEEVKEVA